MTSVLQHTRYGLIKDNEYEDYIFLKDYLICLDTIMRSGKGKISPHHLKIQVLILKLG